MVTTLPLLFTNGHLFAGIGDEAWLLDTGSPQSFGPSVELGGTSFPLPRGALGLDPRGLSGLVGVDCAGLLGMDVLAHFDLVLDVPAGRLELSRDRLELPGSAVPLDVLAGIPIVSAGIGEREHRLFLDTGAQLSYLPGEALAPFPPAGRVADFYPGIGEFEVDTRTVEVRVGGHRFALRCGALPPVLSAALLVAAADGILGNEFLLDRPVGFFPRRRVVVIGTPPGERANAPGREPPGR